MRMLSGQEPRTPLIIAHRGWSEIAPENSHAAFAAAVSTPCAGIELDLRLTADGVVVACHDAHLGRFGGSRVPLSRRHAAELALPSLAEILERYAAQRELLLELKPHGGPQHTTRLITAVCQQVRQHRERVLILCFSPGVLRAVAALDRRLRLVRNCERLPDNPAWFRAQAWCWGVDAWHRAWTPTRVRAAREAGLMPAAFTVDRAADLRRCQRLGLDLVITNRPGWAHAQLALPAAAW
jgi:glycerophosphoryl diester phosphodiesterase